MYQDKFENAKKTMESKSQNDRTKEEVENFNAMVKQINKEITAYNK
jgi:wobble nucleotide-excising tRNase